jgi:redox-sensitive bicupin YhaK (pirin superfamily)
MGSRETLPRGSIQFMSAGSGVTHSEHNVDEKAPFGFIQIWIPPRAPNTKPYYGSALGRPEDPYGRWFVCLFQCRLH